MRLSEIDFSKDGREYLMHGVRVYTKEGNLFFKNTHKNILETGLSLNFVVDEADFKPTLPEIEVGNVVDTTNGEFRILEIDVPEYPETPNYGAMFVDEYEIQYMSNTLDDLLSQILADGDLIEVRDY